MAFLRVFQDRPTAHHMDNMDIKTLLGVLSDKHDRISIGEGGTRQGLLLLGLRVYSSPCIQEYSRVSADVDGCAIACLMLFAWPEVAFDA